MTGFRGQGLNLGRGTLVNTSLNSYHNVHVHASSAVHTYLQFILGWHGNWLRPGLAVHRYSQRKQGKQASATGNRTPSVPRAWTAFQAQQVNCNYTRYQASLQQDMYNGKVCWAHTRVHKPCTKAAGHTGYRHLLASFPKPLGWPTGTH